MDLSKKVKAHVKKHEVLYTAIGTSAVIAVITALIMRDRDSEHISVAIGDAASGAIGVAGKSVVMNNVSFISANRQGSPSWVVRCLETDTVQTSQKKMAENMSLPQNHLSEHLNGKRDHVDGYHFERLCLAG